MVTLVNIKTLFHSWSVNYYYYYYYKDSMLFI